MSEEATKRAGKIVTVPKRKRAIGVWQCGDGSTVAQSSRSAPLVAPVVVQVEAIPPPVEVPPGEALDFYFHEHRIEMDQTLIFETQVPIYQSTDILEPYVGTREVMVVTYRSDYGQERKEFRVIPQGADDPIQKYVREMQDVEVSLSHRPYKVHRAALCPAFEELRKLAWSVLAHRHTGTFCTPCRAALVVCGTHRDLGTFGVANLIAQNFPAFTEAIEKSPCTCGVEIAGSMLSITSRIIDGVQRI